MRILIATSSYWPEVGGVQSVVFNLARRAKKAGHEPIVVATRAKGLRSSDTYEGIPVHRLPFIAPEASRYMIAFTRTFWESFSGFSRIIRDLKPDIINTHFVSTGNSLFSLIASKQFGLPLVASVHGEDVIGMPLQSTAARLISRMTLRRSMAATACSVYMAEIAANLADIPLPKISVIRNGVDLAEFKVTGQKTATNRSGIFSAGRFVGKKGFDILINAFAQVKAKHPAARLVLAGDGPDRTRLEDIVRRLNLSESIEFPGMADRRLVVRQFEQCKIFVLPSRREPLGITVLEAMAAGAPVIATRVGGVPEIVENGKNGILVESDNPDKLAEAILHLLGDVHLCEQFSREGRRLVEEQYSWEHTGSQFLSALESALSRPVDNLKYQRKEVHT